MLTYYWQWSSIWKKPLWHYLVLHLTAIGQNIRLLPENLPVTLPFPYQCQTTGLSNSILTHSWIYQGNVSHITWRAGTPGTHKMVADCWLSSKPLLMSAPPTNTATRQQKPSIGIMLHTAEDEAMKKSCFIHCQVDLFTVRWDQVDPTVHKEHKS